MDGLLGTGALLGNAMNRAGSGDIASLLRADRIRPNVVV